MLKHKYIFFIMIFLGTVVSAEENVLFVGDFESGQFQPNGEDHDGFNVKTLPDPQGNIEQWVISNGGGGPDSNLDTRVVPREQVGASVVRPRRGEYFVRTAIYFDKKYDGFSGNAELNKPRTNMIVKRDRFKFDFDEEVYTGFSIYLPEDLEHERGKPGEQGKNMLMNVSAPNAAELFTLSYWVPRSAGQNGVSHWWLRINHARTATSSGENENIDLGPVVGDLGKWTDFVVRWRANPFSEDTNPKKAGFANGIDKLYRGNRGILQLWKAVGPVDGSGNREMVLVVNRLNEPVGNIPQEGLQLGHSFRQYKHGWHRQPTTVKGPVWVGFDEIRFGSANRDGTGYLDVQPARLPCIGDCPNGSSSDLTPTAAPKPSPKPNPPEFFISP